MFFLKSHLSTIPSTFSSTSIWATINHFMVPSQMSARGLLLFWKPFISITLVNSSMHYILFHMVSSYVPAPGLHSLYSSSIS